jgi:hypothetical protein
MRRLLSFLIIPALALPALADEPPKAEATAHHVRETWQQHFARANAAHDGHLTAQEAKGGFAPAAKHFDDIDVDHKGYITENDVRAWRVMRKAARRLAKPQEDNHRPRAAFQRTHPEAKTINTSSRQTMAATTERRFADN